MKANVCQPNSPHCLDRRLSILLQLSPAKCSENPSDYASCVFANKCLPYTSLLLFSNFQKFPQTYGLLVISFLVPQLVINAFFNCIFCIISIRFWQREEVDVCTQSAILKWKSSPVFDPQLSFYRQSKCNLSPVRRFQFKLSFSF